MDRRKGGQNRYSALPARDMELVQQSHLQQRFELAPRSFLAETVRAETNEALEKHQDSNAQRIKPGELLIEHDGKPLRVPLLSTRWSQELAAGFSPAAVRSHLEYEQLQVLLEADNEATIEDLWAWTNQKQLVRKRGGKDFLPEKPLNVNELEAFPRPKGEISLPDSFLEPIVSKLNKEHGCKPALARAMVQCAAQTHNWCCPRIQELQPGQVVWLVYSTQSTKRGAKRLLVPVILTLITSDEISQPLNDHGDLKALKLKQIERISAEAWQQDGVLTMLDLEWLLNVNGAFLRKLLTAYQEHFGVILPTAGTVLDMGRTLTHKTIVVEMALEGMSTKQIAESIFHTAEAVDNYLRLFDRILVLKYYGLPLNLIRQVTGHSTALLKEHIQIADKHFPKQSDLTAYLFDRGVDIEKAQ